MLLFFLLFVNSIYIVQTNNSTLHFILNSKVHEIKIPSLDLEAEKNKHKVQGQLVKSEETDIVLSSRDYIESILVTPDGHILIEGQTFTVDSIIDKPKIVNNTVFQTQKRCGTAQLFNVVVFIVFLDLNIIDTRTMSKRTVSFSYIYHPFSSSKAIEVSGTTLKIKDRTYSFSEDIIAVYNTRDVGGVKYMDRIFFYNGVEIYQPKEPMSTNLLPYFLIPLLIVFLIYLKRKTVKLVVMLEDNNLYSIYEGLYLNKRVIVKWYKQRPSGLTNEINTLYKLDYLYISKLIYHENNIFHTFLVFEYSDKLIQPPSKDLLHQIVLAVKFLNERNFYLRDFEPKNIRISNKHIVLFDICSVNEESVWYSEDEASSNVVFLGCLLHFFITGFHPYDTPPVDESDVMEPSEDLKNKLTQTSEVEDQLLEDIPFNSIENGVISFKFIKAPSFDVGKEIASDITAFKDENTLERIKNNILLRRYKIRVEDPLIHDLIYHTIKNKVKERTTVHKLAVHPFFWDSATKFEFLARYSDILESCPSQAKKIERNKSRIFSKSWNLYLGEIVAEELSVFRMYNYNSAKDLVRVVRNKGRHYNQIPACVKEVYKSFPEGFIDYWCGMFPGLLIVCYNCGYFFKENELLEKFY